MSVSNATSSWVKNQPSLETNVQSGTTARGPERTQSLSQRFASMETSSVESTTVIHERYHDKLKEASRRANVMILHAASYVGRRTDARKTLPYSARFSAISLFPDRWAILLRKCSY